MPLLTFQNGRSLELEETCLFRYVCEHCDEQVVFDARLGAKAPAEPNVFLTSEEREALAAKRHGYFQTDEGPPPSLRPIPPPCPSCKRYSSKVKGWLRGRQGADELNAVYLAAPIVFFGLSAIVGPLVALLVAAPLGIGLWFWRGAQLERLRAAYDPDGDPKQRFGRDNAFVLAKSRCVAESEQADAPPWALVWDHAVDLRPPWNASVRPAASPAPRRPGDGQPDLSDLLGVSEAACLAALAHWSTQLVTRDYLTFDELVRRALRGWRLLRQAAEPARAGPSTPFEALVVLACHPDGHQREAALRELLRREDGRALPFVLIRLTDWVPEVRQCAVTGLNHALSPAWADDAVALLPLLDALARRGRGLEALMQVRCALASPDALPAVLRGTRSPDPAVRLGALRLLADFAPDAADHAATALEDAAVEIRNWGVQALSPDDVTRLVGASRDKAAKVRRTALGRLSAGPVADAAMRTALMDRSAGIRSLARDYFSERGDDAAAWYRALLTTGPGPEARVALLGLAECGTAADVVSALPYLESETPSLRAAAITLVGHLDPVREHDLLVDSLRDDAPNVSAAARRELAARRAPTVAARVLEDLLLDPGRRAHVRRNALELVPRLGRWDAIRLLARACTRPELVDRAGVKISVWFQQINRVFVRATVAELASLETAITEVRAALGDGPVTVGLAQVANDEKRRLAGRTAGAVA